MLRTKKDVGKTRDRLGRTFVPVALALSFGILGGAGKDVTENVVEKGVKAAKDTTKGIEEGIEQGRKQGESADGATIVSASKDLSGKGSIAVRAVRPAAADPTASEVELAFENTTDKPLRITNLEVMALDKEGFAKKPSGPPGEVTVPPKAKEKLVLRFAAESKTLAKVRIWDTEQPVPSAP